MKKLPVVHVGRERANQKGWRVHFDGRRSGLYTRANMAEREAWAVAMRHVAATDEKTLVVGPTGAFEIAVGQYPQKEA